MLPKYISSISLVIMMLIMVADVLLRALFNHPIIGAYDLVGIFLLLTTVFGISIVISKEKEILIDLIDRIIPIKLVKSLKFLTNILTFLIFCFLLYSMINPAISSWKYGDISLELGVPIWFLWLISVIGVSGIILISLGKILKVKIFIHPFIKKK